jgi:hypothetical protein
MTTTEPTTANDPAADVPIGAISPHPDNVRQHLGDLTERSGFHQMRATSVIWILPV